MNKGTDRQEGSADLRRRAEARLIQKSKRRTEAEDPVTAPEMQRLVQEPQIHQIEIEMQNEELTRVRDEAEAERERYPDLYDFAPIDYFTLDHSRAAVR